MSSLRPLHRQAAQHFDERYKRKQSESFLSQQEHTIWVPRNRPLRIKYLHLDVSLWKQYKIQVAKFLFMYSFTYTNIVFLFRHLPTEIVIFINVYFQMNCFSGDRFSFFGEYSTYFFDFMWSSNKVFKDVVIFWTVHSRPFILNMMLFSVLLALPRAT